MESYMPHINHLKIIPLDHPCCHKVILDSIPIRATAVNIDYQVNSIPEAVITVNAIPEIDDHVLASFRFESESVKDCIKFLCLQMQFDKDLYEAAKATIYSALKDLDGEDVCDYDRAGHILDELMR